MDKIRLHKIVNSLSALCIIAVATTAVPAQTSASEVISTNNQGVKALNQENLLLAIELFKRTIGMDPSYQLAKENLAIAYNRLGDSKKETPKEALKWFHLSMVTNPSNSTSVDNVESTIKKLGKDPKTFLDRLELAESSKQDCEFDGAIVEYEEALKLKEDAKTHEALGDVLILVDENDKAVVEYEKANELAQSSELEEKIEKTKRMHKYAYGSSRKPAAINSATLEKGQPEWGIKQYQTMQESIALFAAQKYDLAIQSFQQVIAESSAEQNMRKADASVYIGRCYLAKGQLALAKKFFEIAWKEDREFWGLNDAHKEYVKAVAVQKKQKSHPTERN